MLDINDLGLLHVTIKIKIKLNDVYRTRHYFIFSVCRGRAYGKKNIGLSSFPQTIWPLSDVSHLEVGKKEPSGTTASVASMIIFRRDYYLRLNLF